MHEEEYLGLDIELLAFPWGEVTVYICTPSALLKTNDYHYRDWERFGTKGILEYWKGQIDSGEIWE